jgi:serine protease Do
VRPDEHAHHGNGDLSVAIARRAFCGRPSPDGILRAVKGLPGLLAVSFLSAACASTAVSSRSEVIRRILPSTVQLRAEREAGGRRTASGVILLADAAAHRSWILTTKHFLEPPERQAISVTVPGRSGRLSATVVAVSPDVDLALLVVTEALPPVTLKPTVKLGDEVWVVAYPFGRRRTLVSGVVSQISATADDAAVEGPARMVDASVSYGASGGGVFDAPTGALVGIVESYRTARMTTPESRTIEVPVPGETTLISAEAVVRFVHASGLEALLDK